MMIHY